MFVQNLLTLCLPRFNGAGNIIRWVDFALNPSRIIGEGQKHSINKMRL
jgi:hypothetical protein